MENRHHQTPTICNQRGIDSIQNLLKEIFKATKIQGFTFFDMNTKSNKCILIFLILCVSHAIAADWSQIHTFRNGAKVYSSESYILEDGTVRTFLKIVKGKNSGSPFAILINCEQRLVRNYVAGQFGSEFYVPWEPITPDTVGEVAVNSFCKNVLKAKEESTLKEEQADRLKSERASNFAKEYAPSEGYLGRLRARVKPNITFSDSQLQSVQGNPLAVVETTCDTSGKIVSKQLIRSSGSSAWDEAVMNAIDKTGSLPRDENGNMPPKISFGFRPRD
jgi:TonB family protein